MSGVSVALIWRGEGGGVIEGVYLSTYFEGKVVYWFHVPVGIPWRTRNIRFVFFLSGLFSLCFVMFVFGFFGGCFLLFFCFLRESDFPCSVYRDTS